MAMKTSEPKGRAMKASEKIAKDHSVPVSASTKGKNSTGNTSTEAMA